MHFYSNSFEEENLRKDSFLPPATHPTMQHRSMPIVRSYSIRDEYRDRFSIPVEKNLRSASIEEDQPLRIHVGNIPFLWTIDDLRKQFLVILISFTDLSFSLSLCQVFGPVKDPEIVSNERGSKVNERGGGFFSV